MRYIIADAGSTKTDWATIVDGKVCERMAGSGINPSVMSEDEIRKAVVEVSQLFIDASPDAVYFYGAGCKAEVAHKCSSHILCSVFSSSGEPGKQKIFGATLDQHLAIDVSRFEVLDLLYCWSPRDSTGAM